MKHTQPQNTKTNTHSRLALPLQPALLRLLPSQGLLQPCISGFDLPAHGAGFLLGLLLF
jgi:hypothetical protein